MPIPLPTPLDVLAAIQAAPVAHGIGGSAGWTDEIVSFGFIAAILGGLFVLSRMGRKNRKRPRNRG